MVIQEGIVYNTSTNKVLYKFETESLPTLNAGEAIVLRNDAQLIEVGATYNPSTGEYTNPPIPPPVPYIDVVIKMFTTQRMDTIKVNAPDTVAIPNLGTSFIGFGQSSVIRMDGYKKIRLIMRGANAALQIGTVTVKVVNVTDSTDLVSLTFSDTIVQFREAVADISLTGLKRIMMQANSTELLDSPLFGDISIALER